MKNKVFDILENSDDSIIEELLPYSSDDENTRRRVLKMTENKYRNMTGIQEGESENEEAVSGVELYHRPVWHKPLCAAAAIALIAGSIGTLAFLNTNRMKGDTPRSPQAAQVNELGTANLTEAPTEVTTEITPVLLTDSEMKALFEECLPIYIGSDSFSTTDETVHFWRYYGVDEDDLYDPVRDVKLRKEDGVLYYDETYYRLDDPLYSNLQKMQAYYAKYFEDPSAINNIGRDLSSYAPGAVIYKDAESCTNDYDIIEYNGAIYVGEAIKSSYYLKEWKDVIADHCLEVSENDFIWERVFRQEYYNDDTWAESAMIRFVKVADGSWKIGGVGFKGEYYDHGKDYSGGTASDFYDIQKRP